MLFKRRKTLRQQFDEKLLANMANLKMEWQNKSSLLKKSFDPSMEIVMSQKLSEAKYFYLFSELKSRKITVKND